MEVRGVRTPVAARGGDETSAKALAGELAHIQRTVFLLLAKAKLTDQFLSRERPL